MKFYDIDTVFNFGKYAGKSVREVLEIQPSYIDWCIINLDHFYIMPEDIDYIKSIKPDFTLSADGLSALADKYNEWDKIQIYLICYPNGKKPDNARYKYKKRDYDYNDSYNDFDWKAETFEALTDGMCGDYYDDYGGDSDIESVMTYLGLD
jgi:hypothetical protein